MIHLQDEYLDDKGFPDATKLNLVGRMGGNWYARASGDALFEVTKPTRTKGIGIDELPQSIRESTVLTGNDLGKLGGVEALPKREKALKLVSKLNLDPTLTTREIHIEAQALISNGHVDKALALLMLID